MVSNRSALVSNRRENNNPKGTVVYDGQCQICRYLALKIRDSSNESIDVLPLESNKAKQLLQSFYSEEVEHDFYFVEDESCSKGIRAIPKIAQATGIRDFSGLIKSYATLKNRSNQDSDCGCGHDHDENSKIPSTTESESYISRRAFTGAMSTAAVTLMASPVFGADDTSSWTPQNLEVNVATVTEDGNGDFEATVERRQDLVHSEDPLEGEPGNQNATPDQDITPAERELSSESAELATSSFGSSGEVVINSLTSTLDIEDADPELQRAASAQDHNNGPGNSPGGNRGNGPGNSRSDEALAQATIYNSNADHQRFDLRINADQAPAVRETGEAIVQTTMAGEIQHDTAVPVIDYVVFNGDATVSEHIDAYVTGVEQLQEFHADNDIEELVAVYDDIKDGLDETQTSFTENVDEEELVAVSNHIGISGVSGFHRYALPPEEYQSNSLSTQSITSCDAECGCGIGACCGCGLDIGACNTVIRICGCCVASCGCGIECCVNL